MSVVGGRRAVVCGLASLLLLSPAEVLAQWCGDGVLDPSETCDLGIGNDAGGSCTPECTLAVCGDGVRSLLEACDDDNALNGDGCSADCRDESQPRWSATVDRDAETNEWFDGVQRVGDRIFVLHQTSELWQEWSSTLRAYDLDGNEQWESFFGPEPFNQIGAFAIAGDRLFVGGRRFGSSSGAEAVLGAYTLDGSVIGESQLLGIEHVSVVLIGPEGDLFLGGQRRHDDADRWFGRYSVEQGTLRWSSSQPRVGGTENVYFGAFSPDLGLYFCGEVGRAAFVVRVDAESGALLWEDRPHESETAFGAEANGLALDGEQIVVVGTTQFPNTEVVDWHSQGWVAAYTLQGEPRWDAVEAAEFAAYDGLSAVAARSDGSVVVAGYQAHEGLAAPVEWDRDGLIVEYAADGTRGRELRYDGPLHHKDNFSALTVLDEDRVLVSGTSMGLAAAEVGLLAEFELPPLLARAEREPPPSEVGTLPEPMHGPIPPHAETLYIDFDGASLSPGSDGRLEQMSCIDGAFEYPGLDAGRAFVEATVEHVREHLEPFDITVHWETRPDAGLPYTTVLVGGAPEQLGFDESTQGYACQVDCGNQHANELVLAFNDSSEQALANTIVHEAAHAWGLDHVIDGESLMSPFSPADEAALFDRCVEISEATSSPVCIEAHASFCPPGQQNEHAEMTERFGQRRDDLEAPTLLHLPTEVVVLEP
ncbi:MAG: hypothetical protein KUG77_20160, partial [Nannocystaceae bacterium]|nr:hypothetical protein [Nannocystaceae bacterium]